MHTISSLRKTLGLTTTNQVRNRIESIRDVLSEHLRRGPNNQILIGDAGVELLRRLQDLYDSGLTMAEASSVLRAKGYRIDVGREEDKQAFISNIAKPGDTEALILALNEEIEFLRERVAYLEEQSRISKGPPPLHERAWWEDLREDSDAS